MNISHKALLPGLAVLAALGLGVRPAPADTLTTFDFPGATSTRAISINDSGNLVGAITDSSGNTRGYERLANGTFSAAIADPNDNQGYTRATGISNAGVIAGDYLNYAGNNYYAYHGYLLNGSAFTQFDVSSTVSTDILGMDGAGDFVGVYGSNTQTNEGFFDVGGVLTTFNGPSGSTGTFANGINSSGKVIGQYQDSAGNLHGFSRDPATGALTTIDVPGSTSTSPNTINNAGTIVGSYNDSNGNTHGYFERGGVFTTFDVPGSTFTVIRGINNAGVIVGTYVDSSGNQHGFIDTPPPGHTHVLWTNPDGHVILWSIAQDGSHTFHTFGPYTDGSASTPWTARALSTGPDGLNHILWTNPDGHVILWAVDDTGNFTPHTFGPYTDGSASTPWTARALATGPDGLSHILWTNPDGHVILWTVSDAGKFTSAVYGPYTDGSPSTPWSTVALSVGADNLVHILWTNPDGHVILWNVDTTFKFTSAVYGPYTDGSASTPWSATALATGPDGLSHILWNNPDGHVILWAVDTAFHFTSHTFGPYTDGSASTPWSATAVAAGAGQPQPHPVGQPGRQGHPVGRG